MRAKQEGICTDGLNGEFFRLMLEVTKLMRVLPRDQKVRRWNCRSRASRRSVVACSRDVCQRIQFLVSRRKCS